MTRTDSQWINEARGLVQSGGLEIDDDAKVSHCPQGYGVWIQCWIWIVDDALAQLHTRMPEDW